MLCLGRCPQLLAEIEVATYGHTMTLGSLTCHKGKRGSLVADGGRNATPVKPVGVFHNRIKIEVLGSSFGH